MAVHLGLGAAVLMGVLTGIGGGMARDVLTLRSCRASGCGRACRRQPRFPGIRAGSGAIGGIVCVVLLLMAIRNRWTLPVVQQPDFPPRSNSSVFPAVCRRREI